MSSAVVMKMGLKRTKRVVKPKKEPSQGRIKGKRAYTQSEDGFPRLK